MNPVNPLVDGTPICNQTFSGPKDLLTADGIGCEDLPVYISKDGQIQSFWKPSTEELVALNAGQLVTLTCVGLQPVCSVHVTNSIDPEGG